MSPDLKLVYRIVIPIVLLAELLALTGVMRSPHSEFLSRGLKDFGHVGIYALDFLLLYVFSRPPIAERRAVLASGAALSVVLAIAFGEPWPNAPHWYWVFLTGAGFGLSALLALVLRLRYRTSEADLTIDLLAACGLAVLVDPTLTAYLHLTAALHPETFDIPLFRLDAMLGFQPSTTFALIAAQVPPFASLMNFVYLILLYGISVLYAMQRSGSLRLPVNIIVFSVVSAMIGTFLYQLYPVCGPKYAFGNAFPGFLPSPESLSTSPAVVDPAPRNGMPSMHFGWALALWLNAAFLNVAWARGLFAILLGLTAVATLALGEHYLIDLVVAIPLVVAVQALCSSGIPWTSAERRNAAIWGFALTALWIVGLRIGMDVLVSVPGLLWLAVIATVVAGIGLYRPLAKVSRAFVAGDSVSPAMSSDCRPRSSRELRVAVAMFLLSGFAGLAYQVLFSKSLALTFGSTSTATYTVLATYMAGMAIGAWLGGQLASVRGDVLRLYGACELGIAVYCLATPLIFGAMQAVYVSAAGDMSPDAAPLTVLRVVLGGCTLLVPTVLMGMTLPILARFLEGHTSSLGVSVAALYGANTLGAAVGALATGYFVLPALGISGSLVVAALANAVVAAMAYRWWKATGAQAALPTGVPSVVASAGQVDRPLAAVALLVLLAGGFVTLALEVTYVHLLAVVAGNSVYAFSLMLATFLLGLAAGAEIMRRVLRHNVQLTLLLAWLQWGLAGAVLGGVFIWNSLPGYFASFENYPMTRGFGAREVVRGLVCFVAMFPPAMFIGAAYPVAMDMIGKAYPASPVRALGYAAAVNTVGNIAGVLVAGFVLLPGLGALRSVQVLALACFCTGSLVLLLDRSHRGAQGGGWRRAVRRWGPALAVGVLMAAQPRSFDYDALASGANVYFVRQDWGRIIDHAESVDGGLTAVAVQGSSYDTPLAGSSGSGATEAEAGSRPVLTLLTNGKFQGNDAIDGEMQAQIGFALSPLLHTQRRDRALVIGFGTGVSARTLHAAGFRQMDIVDLSADVIRLATRHFAGVNDRVVDKPGVTTYITDGRNFLMLQNRTYDVVSIEITSIWFAGAASLYNREFYQLAKRRMKSHGVLQQWMQLHHLGAIDMLHIIGSVRAEFRYVWLYVIGGQGMIIASNDSAAQPSLANASVLDQATGLRELLAMVGGSAQPLLGARLLDPAATDRFLEGFGVQPSYWISTDDNLFLEHSTPRGNSLDSNSSFEQNLQLLRSRSAASKSPVTPVPRP